MGSFRLHANAGERKVTDTRIIGGRKYRLHSRNFNGRDAKEEVIKLRDRGMNAVIVTYKHDPLWYVFKN